jgi:hypothetical protein
VFPADVCFPFSRPQAASQAQSIGDSVALLTKAVNAGKWCLDTRDSSVPGWQHSHMRPYMRALFALSRALFQVSVAVLPLAVHTVHARSRQAKACKPPTCSLPLSLPLSLSLSLSPPPPFVVSLCVLSLWLSLSAVLDVRSTSAQAGRYPDGIPHSMKLLELDASDPLHQAPTLLEVLLRCFVVHSHSSSSSSSVPSRGAPSDALDIVNKGLLIPSILARYGTVHDGVNAKWTYATALFKFATTSPSVPDSERVFAECDALLQTAMRLNAGVPALLLREAAIDGAFPSSAGASGSEEEAIAVASSLLDVWHLVPGAAAWCARVRAGSAPAMHTAAATGPVDGPEGATA